MNAVHTPTATAMSARERLLELMQVTERQLELAGIPTSVLEAGTGPAMVLLHGPGEYAAKWLRVIPMPCHAASTGWFTSRTGVPLAMWPKSASMSSG